MSLSKSVIIFVVLFLFSYAAASESRFERKQSYLTYEQDSPAIHFFDDLTFSGSIMTFFQTSTGADDISSTIPVPFDWENRVAANHAMNFEVRSHIRDGDLVFLRFNASEGLGLSAVDPALPVPPALQPLSPVNATAITNTSNINPATTHGDLRLLEAYWERESYHNNLVFTLGKLDATQYFDQNRYANDPEKQFINYMFCNASTIEFPDYSLGMRLSWHPTDVVELTYGLFEATGSYGLLSAPTTRWNDLSDGTFQALQVNFKPHWYRWHDFLGHYRAYGWVETSRHSRIDDANAQETNRGYGLSFDQQFSDHWGGFLRASWQNQNINRVGRNWSAGMNFTGRPWYTRPVTAGLGIGQNILSADAEDNLPYVNENTSPETHLELWARIPVTERMSFTPNFILINNPEAFADNGTVTMLGIRGRITF